MKPHTRKLYQLVRAKLHLGEQDGMKFINGLQAEVKESTQEFVSKDFLHQTVSEAKSELIKWMFIFWVGQAAVTYMIVSLIKN
jgi:flagellar biosynthesis chaperone FliJ